MRFLRALIACISLLALASCERGYDKRVTLWRGDRIAYGTWYAYNELGHLFPGAEISTSNVSPTTFYADDTTSGAYVIIGKYIRPDEKELDAIINYASRGNHVFMSAAIFGQNLLDSFHLETTAWEPESFFGDSMSLVVRDRTHHSWVPFAYPGYAVDNRILKVDTSLAYVLGKTAAGKIDFVRFRYATGGTITFHLAPAAFTNFFLLHKNNKRYYDLAMSTIPPVKRLRWDDYYRHHTNGQDDAQRDSFSKLAAFMRDPVLRWAFWLTIVLFILIYVVESKRKQRPIPVVSPLRNNSLDFVQTIGRLYFQRKDNGNLAQKMTANFLGHVRAQYKLGTNRLDEEFENKLSFKSGYPLEKIKEMTAFMRQSEQTGVASDEALLAFGQLTDGFFKKT